MEKQERRYIGIRISAVPSNHIPAEILSYLAVASTPHILQHILYITYFALGPTPTLHTTQFSTLYIQYQGCTGLSYLVALSTYTAHIASNWGYSTPLTQDEEISQQTAWLLTSYSLPDDHQSPSLVANLSDAMYLVSSWLELFWEDVQNCVLRSAP